MKYNAMSESKILTVDEQLPKLSSAESVNDIAESRKNYKSGAYFQGSLIDDVKSGKGVFVWPNGVRYEGEFKNNLRCGKGIQIWPDGSVYKGDFVDDLRHGYGIQQWQNGESYEGEFFKDFRHGKGRYNWPDGSNYIGFFYKNKRESYGSFICPNIGKFDGLYKEDERFGPGILTYLNGEQDVGLWYREQLVKFNTTVKHSFSILNRKEFSYFPEDHVAYLDDIEKPLWDEFEKSFEESLIRHSEILKQNTFVSLQEEDSSTTLDRINSLPKESSSLLSTSSSRKSKTKKKSKSREKKLTLVRTPIDPNRIRIWNRTKIMVEIQKHYLRNKSRECYANFDVERVVSFNRDGFANKGVLERRSEEFIDAASSGNKEFIEEILKEKLIYADVADRNGHTALIGASVNWNCDIINILLDSGANVNKLTDEGISVLSVCFIYFYPPVTFQYNIAEKLPIESKPNDFPVEPLYDAYEAVKNILHVQQLEKKRSTSHMKRELSNLEKNRIEKYRKEYSFDEIKLPRISNNKSFLVENTGKDVAINDNGGNCLVVNRAEKLDIDDILAIREEDLAHIEYGKGFDEDSVIYDESQPGEQNYEEFESSNSIKNLEIDVTDKMIDKYATELQRNQSVISKRATANSNRESVGTVRCVAMDRAERDLMEETIHLLLKRGADPNSSTVPMPVLFFAIKAADVKAVKELLIYGASTAVKLPDPEGGLYPLHIASAIIGEEGVEITRLILDALADPDVQTIEDDSYLNVTLQDEWIKDKISEEKQELLGGRTALHIACSRDDNYEYAGKVVKLLLDHHANPNLLVNGFSPLALCIVSGNDIAISELLKKNADPNLQLTHGVGTALCTATVTDYENRRTPKERLKLIDKLISNGADILAPIAVGPKRSLGTAVDYAYYIFNLDRRIAHMPYHALNPAERLIFNSRKDLLSHVGKILRLKAVENERKLVEAEKSAPPSRNFIFTGSGRRLDKPSGQNENEIRAETDERIGIVVIDARDGISVDSVLARHARKTMKSRRAVFKYCYECGRSVGVKLTACTRCKEIFYCSKICKMKAWNSRHKEECLRVGNVSSSPKPGNRKRIDSPTPATDANKDKTPIKKLMNPREIRKEQRVILNKVNKFGKESKETKESEIMKKYCSLQTKGSLKKLAAAHTGYNRALLVKLFGTKEACRLMHNNALDNFNGGYLRNPTTGQFVWIDNYSWV